MMYLCKLVENLPTRSRDIIVHTRICPNANADINAKGDPDQKQYVPFDSWYYD